MTESDRKQERLRTWRLKWAGTLRGSFPSAWELTLILRY